MIKKIRYGFIVDKINYGWIKGSLYRLPQMMGKRFMALKKLKKQGINGTAEGYYVGNPPRLKTIKQMETMTEVINYEHVINGKNSDDTPF